MNQSSRPFGLWDKLGYMFGDFGNDFSFIFASSYLMVFYTKVLGLSGTIVGALFLTARIVDAFTDVTMGRIVDSLPTARDGRFRPWIRRMCIPVAVASTIMYLYFVQDWAYPAKVAYVVITYILWSSFCYTAINIPYGSMASVISAEPGDRASLSTYRSVGASLASLVIGTLVPFVIYETDALGNQVVSPARFTLTAVIFGIFAVICYALCYFLCSERVFFEKKEKQKGEKAGQILTSLGKNKPLLALVCAALILLLASMLGQTMNNYLFLDYFRNAKAVAWVNLITVGAMLLMAPFISKITVAFGKKEAGVVGMLVAGVFYLLLFFLRVKSIPLFMVFLFLGTVGTGLFNMIIWAFITDIIDYQEVKTGKREDGTVYAVYSFARKLGQALAGGLGGFALTAIGYISDASVQSEEVAERIYTVATLIPGICYFLVFLIMLFWYPLSKSEVENNTRILQEKRQNKE
ncbi:MAG: MFS transporter [Lachnospiraceae bacterium]|nr:MFS transporter [Lachnospiraceae bacterium]